MCRPASFVATRDRVFWSLKTDSHTEIIDEHELHEDGSRGVNVAKVEITPPCGDFSRPLNEWRYKLDQDMTPDWYDPKDCERRCRRELEKWVAQRVVGDGVFTSISGGKVVWALAGSTVKACGSSVVWAYDSSVVEAYGSSVVRAYDSSVVRAYGSSVVEAYGSSVVRAYDSSVVEAYGSSVVRAYDSSVVRAYGSSVVEACGSHATVRQYGDNDPPTPSGPFAVVLDCRGARAVAIVGK